MNILYIITFTTQDHTYTAQTSESIIVLLNFFSSFFSYLLYLSECLKSTAELYKKYSLPRREFALVHISIELLTLLFLSYIKLSMPLIQL